jgi:hypothetical protein
MIAQRTPSAAPRLPIALIAAPLIAPLLRRSRRSAAVLCAVALGASACAAERADTNAPADAGPPVPVVDSAPLPSSDAAPPFAGDVRSLQLVRSIAVRARPDESSEIIGTVARDIRVSWRRAAEGPGCEGRWIELEPRGWICEQHLTPSKRAPWGVEMPRLDYGEIVPGVYGKVIAEEARSYVLTDEGVLVPHRMLSGSVMVRRHDEVTLSARSAPEPAAPPSAAAPPSTAGRTAQTPSAPAAPPGRVPAQQLAGDGSPAVRSAPAGQPASYWLIDRAAREYLPTKSIRVFQPSTFQGTRLGDETGLVLPVGFPLSRARVTERVPVYSAAQGGRVVRKLEACGWPGGGFVCSTRRATPRTTRSRIASARPSGCARARCGWRSPPSRRRSPGRTSAGSTSISTSRS